MRDAIALRQRIARRLLALKAMGAPARLILAAFRFLRRLAEMTFVSVADALLYV